MSLDRKIAEARAQIARLKEDAAAGDQIAAQEAARNRVSVQVIVRANSSRRLRARL